MAAMYNTLSAAFKGLLDTALPEQMSHLTRTTLSFDNDRLGFYIDITFSFINDEPTSIHDEFIFEPTEQYDLPSDFVSSIADTISTSIYNYKRARKYHSCSSWHTVQPRSTKGAPAVHYLLAISRGARRHTAPCNSKRGRS